MKTLNSGGVLLSLAVAATFASGSLHAAPSVSGNVISWTDDGWHQVQVQGTYESLCEGGTQCTVPAGVYIVVNHGTGERFLNIPVGGSHDDIAMPVSVQLRLPPLALS